MAKISSKRLTAGVFTTGRSPGVRLAKEYRLDTDTVLVHREGNAVILEPIREWRRGTWNHSPACRMTSSGRLRLSSRAIEVTRVNRTFAAPVHAVTEPVIEVSHVNRTRAARVHAVSEPTIDVISYQSRGQRAVYAVAEATIKVVAYQSDAHGTCHAAREATIKVAACQSTCAARVHAVADGAIDVTSP
jgi:virulence-associated protein VagC